jgi:TetR/AcrR family transcriptional regulator, mexJK operon transcriptional repressor
MDEQTTVKRKVYRSPGRPTRDQAEQRNLELLDKSLDLFLEHGFERTTIEAITAAVGMAKRTVYARYGDKLTLFKAALHRAIEEWMVPIERLREAETVDLEETLQQVGQILVANILTPAGLRLMRITNAESIRMPEIAEYTVREGTEPTMRFLTDLLRRRLTDPRPDAEEAQDAANAFLHLVVGGPAGTMAWGVHLDDAEIERMTRYSVRLFLHGLLHR